MDKQDTTGEKVTKPKNTKKEYIFAVGRRREATARVRLYPSVKENIIWGDQEVKKGEIFVNGKPVEKYFSSAVAKAQYIEPLRTTNNLNKLTFTIQVVGGGQFGQLEAVIHGMSRTLDKLDPEKYHAILRKKGFLTRDSRTRERRKVGRGGKARRVKQSPKR